jgi:hydroxyethylthiazole kinase-like uncharacterized protein yjeF
MGNCTKNAQNIDDLMLEILTPDEMAEADRLTIAGGVPGRDLMEAAGRAVADRAADMAGRGASVLVLAGPGNNGGDGFVAARLLAGQGVTVRVALLGRREALTGDAALAAADYDGPVEALTAETQLDAALVIDALFGAGLARPLEGDVAALVGRVNETGLPVLAVDLPSGIDGRTGLVRGAAVQAAQTVTFFRLKPGHLLMPGRAYSGAVSIAQIGIDEAALETVGPVLFDNQPGLWRAAVPYPDPAGHKYDRGHALVVCGPATRTGAARLAARGALRIGAGLVTVASPPEALLVNAAHLTAIMIARMDGAEGLARILEDKRFTAVAIGPAAGIGEETRNAVTACLESHAAVVVLDADALTSFADRPETLWQLIRARRAPVLLTPHEGEFARIFPDLGAIDSEGNGDARPRSKVERARAAAESAGCAVIFKGADTVVAMPDGRASICGHAPPYLATAGSGDVLTGIAAGLLAQRVPPFEAACAAVWLHADAACRFGPGLIAEDLPDKLPAVIKNTIIGNII